MYFLHRGFEVSPHAACGAIPFSGAREPSLYPLFAGGYLYVLLRQPLQASYSYVPLRNPPPHPRLRRSSPAPSAGRGQCVVISSGQPCPVLPRDLPGKWTVRLSPRGEGTGEGVFPLPAGGNSYVPLWQPPRAGYSYVLLRHPHPARPGFPHAKMRRCGTGSAEIRPHGAVAAKDK